MGNIVNTTSCVPGVVVSRSTTSSKSTPLSFSTSDICSSAVSPSLVGPSAPPIAERTAECGSTAAKKETEASTLAQLVLLAKQVVPENTCGDGYAFLSTDGSTIESVYTCRNKIPEPRKGANDTCERCRTFLKDQNAVYKLLPTTPPEIRQAWCRARIPVMLKWAMDNLHMTPIDAHLGEVRMYASSNFPSRRYIGHFIDIVE